MSSPAENLARFAGRFDGIGPPKYQHVEAFCLMHYACKCGHQEVMWNSRDGVTPFTTRCPSCGQPELTHTMRGMQRRPDHTPHKGQRVWIDMTRERAEQFARQRLNVMGVTPENDAPGMFETRVKRIADSFFTHGVAPDMRIEGYTEA
jgi:hypothetical protein